MRRRVRASWVVFYLFGFVSPAAFAAGVDGAPPALTAVRTGTPPRIDGRLDDPAWSAAQPFTAFVQSYPTQGAAPTERTEARILYDDKYLYVGVRCFDRQPETILRTLGRRDSPPASDSIRVVLDPLLDRRNATSFAITAGEVKQDGLYTNDVQFNPEWDGVWNAKVALLQDGWSAEFAIPLRLLRIPSGVDQQVWGIHLHRGLPRTHEQIDSSLISPGGNRYVSRFNELHGVSALHPVRSVELLPYAAARVALTPQYADDPARPTPRLLDPSGDLGLDLSTQLTSDTTLTATVNPDFGQVEADQIVLNLGTTETFFPEKRPFFTQGLDLFQPVGSEIGSTPHRLFYSRRIGLDTPILGAAKVVGAVGQSTEFGVLDALVMGPVNPSRITLPDEDPLPQDRPDRRLQLHPERPLHLGLNDELPPYRPVTKNFFALVGRRRLGDSSRVGVQLTDVTPLSQACDRTDFPTEEAFRDAGCKVNGQRAAAVDFDVRTPDRLWGAWGQLAGSQLTGHGRSKTLRDGTVLAPGDPGFAGYVHVGKLAGEPFRAFVQYEYANPTFDVNQAGYLPSQNLQSIWGELRFVRSEPWGFLRDITSYLYAGRDWTTDGRGLNRGNVIGLHAEALLPGYNGLGVECAWEDGAFDVREISEQGIPYQKAPDWYCAAGGNTDGNRMLVGSYNFVGFQNLTRGPLQNSWGYKADLGLTFRPTPVLESQLQAHYERPIFSARYLEDLDGGRHLFAHLQAPQLSVTFRQQLVLSPELTLQAYAQLFADTGHYGPYYVGDSNGAPIRMVDLQPAALERSAADDFLDSALNLNVVLRWEYRLGSTLYAVYTRSQSNFPQPGPSSTRISLAGLGRGPAVDTVLLKWSYYWDAAL